MNSSERPPVAIHVLDYSAKRRELAGVPHNPDFPGDGARRLQCLRQKSFFSQSKESLIASHARALAARQDESRNAGLGSNLHLQIIHSRR